MSDIQTFLRVEREDTLAQAIVDTVAEPLVVLDSDLRVVTASRSFCLTFKADRRNIQGQRLYDVGDGQWDIPELRIMLDKIVLEHGVLEACEVDRKFPSIGHRTMRLSVRKVFSEGNSRSTLLLTMDDVTKWRDMERELKELMQQKELLLEEMQHRVANSLTIIASILLLKAKTVQSEETRHHLHDAHRRIVSVAAVQDHLHVSGQAGSVTMSPYLSRLCETLADSMIGESRPISLKVHVAECSVTSSQAVSIGLIVTELVINALKHAFPTATAESQVVVTYEIAGAGWTLSIADNGVGMPDESTGHSGSKKAGLGTSIVKALAQQLEAKIKISSSAAGTTVSITHESLGSSVPAAAAA